MANRGEIAIRIFRACGELGIRTVAIYSEEDKNALFGRRPTSLIRSAREKVPVDAYLSINEIIDLAKAKGATRFIRVMDSFPRTVILQSSAKTQVSNLSDRLTR